MTSTSGAFPSGRSLFRKSHFFRDGRKFIDYVIVVDKLTLSDPLATKRLSNFMVELQRLTLRLELEWSQEHLFILLHVPRKALRHFADVYGIDIYNSGHNYSAPFDIEYKWFRTVLHIEGYDMFTRLFGILTPKERILIASEILAFTRFDTEDNMIGLKKLVQLGYVETHYPLHDGPFECGDITHPRQMNDRQRLHVYWANFRMCFFQQPLNIIEKYYGSDVAFYFAWCGMYNKMLFVATVVGTITFLTSLILRNSMTSPKRDEVCNSNLPICPVCYDRPNCPTISLSTYCGATNMAYLFDNELTLGFSVFMCFWAVYFLNMWYRYENVLKIRWNIDFDDTDTKIRQEYKDSAKTTRLSRFTNEVVPHIPATWKYFYLTITYGTCLLMIFIVVLAIAFITFYKIILGGMLRAGSSQFYKENAHIVTMVTASIIQVFFIRIFGKIYKKMSIWLTNMEHPRTQTDFDNSVIYKRYFLGFTNNYLALFYIAFIKGHFYQPSVKHRLFSFTADRCPPAGCVTVLVMQLAFIMLFKSLIGNLIVFIKPAIVRIFKKHRYVETTQVQQPAWERDYNLADSDRFIMTSEFMEMIIQYGFVMFFSVSFPLAPLCALLNNILELRLDALKLVTRQKRPVPRMVSSIGPWNDIFKGVCFLSVITNAFVFAFTNEFTPRAIYNRKFKTLKGYVNSTFSEFDRNGTICYYKGQRRPPSHPDRYKLTPKYWHEFGYRLVVVAIFEHILMTIVALFSYVIRDVPYAVRLCLEHEKKAELELRSQMITASRRHAPLSGDALEPKLKLITKEKTN